MTEQERLALIGFLEFLVDVSSGQHLKIYKIALSALQDKPAVPDGWKLVPIEPTQAMLAAFNDSDYGRRSLRERYIGMLAAALTPGGELD